MKVQHWISLALLSAIFMTIPSGSLMSQDSLPVEVLNEAPEPSAEIMNEIPEPPVSQAGAAGVGSPSAQVPQHFYFVSSAICLLTLALMIIGYLLIKADKIRSENAIRFLALILIIGGILFLAASGFSNDQLVAITGLLGVVAGYLLGSWKNGRL